MDEVRCDIVIMESLECLPSNIKKEFKHIIIAASRLFGLLYLPNELKIRFYICEKSEFERHKQKTNLEGIDEVIAYTSRVNNIYIVDYGCVKEKYSYLSYSRVLAHECIHVLQFLYSQVPQNQYNWLYESIACYLSGQIKEFNKEEKVTWEAFESSFYNIKDCYGRAYSFGEALFKLYPNEVMEIIKFPNKNDNIFVEVYNSIIYL